MIIRISLGDISAEVVQKDIKNVHLSVHPPAGKVRISAPLRMNVDTIRIFALSKLDWIKRQQKSFETRSAKRLASIWTARAITSGDDAISSKLSKVTLSRRSN
jgi:predicted metal-dependent hydrolase